MHFYFSSCPFSPPCNLFFSHQTHTRTLCGSWLPLWLSVCDANAAVMVSHHLQEHSEELWHPPHVPPVCHCNTGTTGACTFTAGGQRGGKQVLCRFINSDFISICIFIISFLSVFISPSSMLTQKFQLNQTWSLGSVKQHILAKEAQPDKQITPAEAGSVSPGDRFVCIFEEVLMLCSAAEIHAGAPHAEMFLRL